QRVVAAAADDAAGQRPARVDDERVVAGPARQVLGRHGGERDAAAGADGAGGAGRRGGEGGGAGGSAAGAAGHGHSAASGVAADAVWVCRLTDPFVVLAL